MKRRARQGGNREILKRLADPREQPAILDYAASRAERIGGWDRVLISSCQKPSNRSLAGCTIREAAASRRLAETEFIRQLLIEEKCEVGVIGFAMSETNLRKVLSAPFIMIGSDGNASAPYGQLGQSKPHPRHYGTFPRVLGRYVRETQLLDWPAAIHKMTALPARKLNLRKRGALLPGYWADIALFNPSTVADQATFVDPHQYPTGIDYVIVNGVVTIDRGEHTGAGAGIVLEAEN